jgi:hemin uptake protein HemP
MKTTNSRSRSALGDADVQRVSSEQLLGAARKLIITHAGETYLLRVTKNDKLILTK